MAGTATKPSSGSPQAAQRSRPNSESREGGAGLPAAWIRVLVSLVLVWHLAAVALAPMSIAPSSQFVVNIAQGPAMQWYLDLLYLNHGYHFFAPDPGPGHLIRYEVLDDRGDVKAQGEFPNTREYWPRLYYHRYFMLADQVGIPSANEQFRKTWQRRYLEAYARQLLREHDGNSVRLRWIAHDPLLPWLAEQGRKLDDPGGYETLMEVTQRRSDIEPAERDQSSVWQSGQPETASRWQGGIR